MTKRDVFLVAEKATAARFKMAPAIVMKREVQMFEVSRVRGNIFEPSQESVLTLSPSCSTASFGSVGCWKNSIR